MSSTIYIILGFVIIYIIYFLVSLGVVALHAKLTDTSKKAAKVLISSLMISFVGFLVNMLMVVLLSAYLNIIAFCLVIMVISFLVYSSLLRYVQKYGYYDAAMVAAVLAIILNPIWFRLLGVI